MSKKKFKKIFNYQCSITEEPFKTTREAPHPEDLVSIKAFYELNTEMDDRPEHIKKQIAANTPDPVVVKEE